MGEGRLSTLSALGLTLVGTTCCALPLTLVALGAGGAMASLASAAPWLAGLSAHKAWIFAATALCLGYAAYRLRQVEQCDVADARRLRWQQRVLGVSAGLFALSVFAAYALLPLTLWFEAQP